MKYLFLIFLGCAGPLQAAVIANDATLTSGGISGDYAITLTQSIPSGFGWFWVTFDRVNVSFYQFDIMQNDYSIAEGTALFQVNAGTVFDATYVANHTPLFSNLGPANWSFSLPFNTSLYFAYWDQKLSASWPPTANDHYGWIQITNAPGGLVATSGATALSDGIIVGTLTQLPEPSSRFLVGTGFALFALWRTRPKRIVLR
jgi:hypothetical protein